MTLRKNGRNNVGTKTVLMTLTAVAMLLMISNVGLSEITISTPKVAVTQTQKAVTVSGNVTPASSFYDENTYADFDAGSKANFTITNKSVLSMAPYIGTWTRFQNNPVISRGNTGTYNEYMSTAGSAILDGATYKIWGTSLNNTSVPTFGLWTSADGKAWAESGSNPIFKRSLSINAFDYSYIDAPYVIKDGNTYKMWYSGLATDGRWRIGYATSADGKSWARGNNGNPVLDRGLIAKFDGGGVAQPNVMKDGNTFKMWYSGQIEGNAVWQVGYATSADGISWTRQNNSNPVVGFGAKGAYDENGCQYPRVIKDGLTYRMWYTAINQKGVAYATSMDGLKWVKDANNPVLPHSQNSADFDYSGIYQISVMKDGLKFRMWLTGDNLGMRNVGLAEATVEGLTAVYSSKPYNAQDNVTWGMISWNWSMPQGVTGTLETRTSADDSIWTNWLKATNKSVVPSLPNNYFQYRVTMATTDSNIIGFFYNMSLEYHQVLSVDVSLDNTTWYRANGTEKWTIEMALSEGNNTVYVKATDTTPYPQYAKLEVLVDTTAPTGYISINNNKPYTISENVSISLRANDLYGVKKMHLGNSADLSKAPWEPFAANKPWTLVSGDGTKTVYVEFMDSNGLVSKTYSASIILDTTPPTGTMAINDNSTYTTILNVRLTMKASDKNGINGIRMGIDPNLNGTAWGSYATSIQFQLPSGDGPKTIYAQFRDLAGLTTNVSDTITLDTTKPTGGIVIDNGTTMTTNRRVLLTLNASDANGVKDMMISQYPDFVDGVWEPFATSKMWTMPNSFGDNFLYARFKDNAGLVSDKTSASIFIYNKVLAGSIVINNGDPRTGSSKVNLTINLLDNDGSTKMMLSNNAQFTGASWTAYAKTASWDLSAKTDGTYTVYLKFKDMYNFESSVVSASIRIDTTAPKVSITYPTSGLVWDSKNGTLDIKGTASDDVGLSRVEVQIDGGLWIQTQDMNNIQLRTYLTVRGDHTIKMRARDLVGNKAEASVSFTWPEEKKQPVKKALIPGFEGLVLMLAMGLVAIASSRKFRRAQR